MGTLTERVKDSKKEESKGSRFNDKRKKSGETEGGVKVGHMAIVLDGTPVFYKTIWESSESKEEFINEWEELAKKDAADARDEILEAIDYCLDNRMFDVEVVMYGNKGPRDEEKAKKSAKERFSSKRR